MRGVLADRLGTEMGEREPEVPQVLFVGRWDHDVDVVECDRGSASGGGEAPHQDVADPVRAESGQHPERVELLIHRDTPSALVPEKRYRPQGWLRLKGDRRGSNPRPSGP